MNKVTKISELTDLLSVDYLLSEINYKKNTSVPELYGIWFRGQSNSEWELKPKLFREQSEVNEYNMITSFRLKYPEYKTATMTSFDVLCLLQHYGMPTRLLDWTESALIGLYFSVSENDNHDCKLYILNALALNKYVFGFASLGIPEHPCTLLRAELANSSSRWDYVKNIEPILAKPKTKESLIETYIFMDIVKEKGYPLNRDAKPLFDKKREELTEKWINKNVDIEKFIDQINDVLLSPWAVIPYHVEQRMKVQTSVFTLHGGALSRTIISGEPISIEIINEKAKIITEITIPSRAKKEIRRELELLGVHEALLFPDLEHQVRFLNRFWTPENNS